MTATAADAIRRTKIHLAEQAAKAAEAAPVEKAAEAPRRPIEPLKRPLPFFEQDNTVYSAIAEPGTRPEDYDGNHVLWSQLGSEVRKFDRVELSGSNGEWVCEYRVTAVAAGYVNARIKRDPMDVELLDPDIEKGLPEGYEYRYGRNARQELHGIYRISDGHLMNGSQGHKTFQEAKSWFMNHAIFRKADSVKYFPG